MAVKYFNSGFLTLDGDILLKITDISLNYSVDSDEITSFDSDFNKEYYPTFSNWTVSASGIFADDTTEPSKFSGETRVSGATNGIAILEVIKSKATNVGLVLKIDTGNYQTGDVIITSFDLTGALGTKMTYSHLIYKVLGL
jgi:hypothetical protein